VPLGRRLFALQQIAAPRGTFAQEHTGRGADDKDGGQEPGELPQIHQQGEQRRDVAHAPPEEGHGAEEATLHARAHPLELVVVRRLLESLQRHALRLLVGPLLDDAAHDILEVVGDPAFGQIAGHLRERQRPQGRAPAQTGQQRRCPCHDVSGRFDELPEDLHLGRGRKPDGGIDEKEHHHGAGVDVPEEPHQPG